MGFPALSTTLTWDRRQPMCIFLGPTAFEETMELTDLSTSLSKTGRAYEKIKVQS